MTSKKRFNSYEVFYDRTGKMWPLNTGDCLIEVTTCADLAVCIKIQPFIVWFLIYLNNNNNIFFSVDSFLFFCFFFLVIVLSVLLRCMYSDYPFGILKLCKHPIKSTSLKGANLSSLKVYICPSQHTVITSVNVITVSSAKMCKFVLHGMQWLKVIYKAKCVHLIFMI